MEPSWNSSDKPNLPSPTEVGLSPESLGGQASPEPSIPSQEFPGGGGRNSIANNLPAFSPQPHPVQADTTQVINNAPAVQSAPASMVQGAKSIEEVKKKYIIEAQHILTKNSADPHTEAKLIEQTKVNYMRDVYKRNIKLPQE